MCHLGWGLLRAFDLSTYLFKRIDTKKISVQSEAVIKELSGHASFFLQGLKAAGFLPARGRTTAKLTNVMCLEMVVRLSNVDNWKRKRFHFGKEFI